MNFANDKRRSTLNPSFKCSSCNYRDACVSCDQCKNASDLHYLCNVCDYILHQNDLKHHLRNQIDYDISSRTLDNRYKLERRSTIEQSKNLEIYPSLRTEDILMNTSIINNIKQKKLFHDITSFNELENKNTITNYRLNKENNVMSWTANSNPFLNVI